MVELLVRPALAFTELDERVQLAVLHLLELLLDGLRQLVENDLQRAGCTSSSFEWGQF